MSVSRIIQVWIARPIDLDFSESKDIAHSAMVVLTVDLAARIVTVPELGDLDLDSVIRLADTLRAALEAYRTGVLDGPRYAPESDMVLGWLHRYMHKMGLKD